jgi:hypothetical protein
MSTLANGKPMVNPQNKMVPRSNIIVGDTLEVETDLLTTSAGGQNQANKK